MTDPDPLATDSGSIARLVVRVLLLAASVVGWSFGDRWIVAIQAGVELGILVATALRATDWRHVPLSRVARACARPLATLLVVTRWHPSEADLLGLIAGVELAVLALQGAWAQAKKGGAA